jgi:hypothetical protein
VPAHVRPKDDVRDALSGEKMISDARRIVDFSRESTAKCDLLYGRISRLPAENATVERAAATMETPKSAGAVNATP